MRIILGGGGDAEQSKEVDSFYVSLLSTDTIAYLPQAAVPKLCTLQYAEAWLKDRPLLRKFHIKSFQDLTDLNKLADYETLFISGGNTFDLLWQFRHSGFIKALPDLSNADKCIYGVSAGAIVLGDDILSAGIGPEADSNETNLQSFQGASLLKGYNVITHYKESYFEIVKRFVVKTKKPIVAIPEEAGAFFDGLTFKNVGSVALYLITEKGNTIPLPPKQSFVIPSDADIK